MEPDEGTKPSVAVAIPAYNEAEGIAEFLREIDEALGSHVDGLRLVVVDDASTDETVRVLEQLRGELHGTLEVLSNDRNRGHGPTLMSAYRHALDGNPDYILQVDGDGQFQGSDLRRMFVLLTDDAHTVSGVRRFRADPWFRMIMTRMVRTYVRASFDVKARDPNCPLRGYDAAVLRKLLSLLPEDCLIPNLYLTVLASRRGLALLEVDVSHRLRRGSAADGTMFSQGARSPIPWRLVRFSFAALRESRSFKARMDRPDWAQIHA